MKEEEIKIIETKTAILLTPEQLHNFIREAFIKSFGDSIKEYIHK